MDELAGSGDILDRINRLHTPLKYRRRRPKPLTREKAVTNLARSNGGQMTFRMDKCGDKYCGPLFREGKSK